jgi:uncharacterized membrane protein YjfL (UPF0719 family)
MNIQREAWPMMPSRYSILTLLLLALWSTGALARSGEEIVQSLIWGVLSTVVYSLVGIAIGVLGFVLIDWMTPGNLREQIAEQENMALAIVGAAVIIGIAIIIGAVLTS